jgi:hypothetical protein
MLHCCLQKVLALSLVDEFLISGLLNFLVVLHGELARRCLWIRNTELVSYVEQESFCRFVGFVEQESFCRLKVFAGS